MSHEIPPPMLGEMYDEPEAAALLKVAPHTLANWRASKTTPLPYVKLGRLVRYRASDIAQFIAANLVQASVMTRPSNYGPQAKSHKSVIRG